MGTAVQMNAMAAVHDHRPGLEQWMTLHSPAMQAIAERAQQLAQYDIAVLLAGEKELGRVVARMIHNCSPRRQQRFATLDCAALPSRQLEWELFGGYAGGPGAVARRGKPCVLQKCRWGTVLLDGVDGLTLGLQAKLLGLLRERPSITRARVLAASSANLKQAVEEGRFRGDLYCRLSVFCLRLPPLRERWQEGRPV